MKNAQIASSFWGHWMSNELRREFDAHARRLAQVIVDSMPAREQIVRMGSISHQEETLKYLHDSLKRLGCDSTTLPSDDQLYLAFKFALVESVQPQLSAMAQRLSAAKSDGTAAEVLERAQNIIRAVNPRRPTLFLDWLGSYGLTMDDLAELRSEYEYLFGLFGRASELESREDEEWSERSLLERAEIELFQNTASWMGYLSVGEVKLARTGFAHRPFSGVRVIFESAGEIMATNLRYYLRMSEDGDLPPRSRTPG